MATKVQSGFRDRIKHATTEAELKTIKKDFDKVKSAIPVKSVQRTERYFQNQLKSVSTSKPTSEDVVKSGEKKSKKTV